MFHSIERVDVKPLAKALLKEFGSLGGVVPPSRERTLHGHVVIAEGGFRPFKATELFKMGLF